MYDLHYRRYHLGNLCNHQCHQKTFSESEGMKTVRSYKEAIDEMIKWNTQCDCWKYAVIRIEPHRD